MVALLNHRLRRALAFYTCVSLGIVKRIRILKDVSFSPASLVQIIVITLQQVCPAAASAILVAARLETDAFAASNQEGAKIGARVAAPPTG